MSSVQKTTEEKKNKNGNFDVMGFPCQCPKVNPIEHFWENQKLEEVKNIPVGLNNL